MTFTEDEKRMINWLRQQHTCWRTNRIIILLGSVALIGIGILEVSRHGFQWSDILLFAFGAYGTSYTLGCWSGRPEISLLLKLVEVYEKESSA